MKCGEYRMILEETPDAFSLAGIEQHLASCDACREYAQRWGLLRHGLHSLALETHQEPPLGFAARVVHRLAEAASGGLAIDFWEVIGRRVTLAGLLVTLTLLIGLLLPSSSPIRRATATDIASEQMETLVAEHNPYVLDDPSSPGMANSVLTGAEQKAH
jgi:hypothetical protein